MGQGLRSGVRIGFEKAVPKFSSCTLEQLGGHRGPEPDLKTSQCLVKMFHSSIVTPTSTLGRSSFGPLGAVGAGAASATVGARLRCARL